MLRGVVLLYVVAALCGEVLPGSTPILAFLDPHSWVYLVALYGSGAVIARELVRRRKLGWWNLLILGAAYGVLEEGMIVTSWFNPFWADAATLGEKGRALDINWIWAVGLTAYHAVMSVTIPVILVERVFPSRASEPWLGRFGLVIAFLVLIASSIFGLIIFGFMLFKPVGYEHPPGTYVNAVIIFFALVWLGLRRRGAARPSDAAAPPGPWRLRIPALVLTLAWFIAEYIVPSATPVGIVPVLVLLAIVLVARRVIDGWSRRAGWGADHRLALASGVLGFFVLLSPAIEFGPHPPEKNVTGMVAFALGTALALVLLSLRPVHTPELRAEPAANA